MKPETTFVTITPELATEWLKTNTNNRKVRPSVVHRYARDMAGGNWSLTHQGIAFDDHGVLVDGQHRLMAVVESGAMVMMAVSRGVPADSRRAVDVAACARSLVDAASLGFGVDIPSDHVAIVRAMYRGSARSNVPMTPTEAIEFYKAHRTAIEFVAQALPSSLRLVARAPVRASMARATYHEDHQRLREFAEVMATGVNQGPDDVAAILLRNWLLSSNSYSASAMGSLSETYAKAQRAIKAFCARERIGKLYEAVGEQYPLP